MDELHVGDFIVKPCPYSANHYDLFEVRRAVDSEKRTKDYVKDVAYGITLERTVTIIIESQAFDKAEGDSLIDFLKSYKKEKEEVLSQLRSLIIKK